MYNWSQLLGLHARATADFVRNARLECAQERIRVDAVARATEARKRLKRQLAQCAPAKVVLRALCGDLRKRTTVLGAPWQRGRRRRGRHGSGAIGRRAGVRIDEHRPREEHLGEKGCTLSERMSESKRGEFDTATPVMTRTHLFQVDGAVGGASQHDALARQLDGARAQNVVHGGRARPTDVLLDVGSDKYAHT